MTALLLVAGLGLLPGRVYTKNGCTWSDVAGIPPGCNVCGDGNRWCHTLRVLTTGYWL
jgi:hypothetical protein